MLLKKIEKKELIDSTFANHTLVKCIKLINEINTEILFFIIDISVISMANDRATTKYENNFYARYLYGTCIEMYKSIYFCHDTHKKVRKKTFWKKLDIYFDKFGDYHLKGKYADICNQLLSFSQKFNRTKRNIIFHYDEDTMKIYDEFNRTKYNNVINQIVNSFITILQEMHSCLNDFQANIINYVYENITNEGHENIRTGKSSINHCSISHYRHMNNLIKNAEDSLNTAVKRISFFRKDILLYNYIEQCIEGLQLNSLCIDEIKKIKNISATHLLINFMLGDLSCCLKAYLTSVFDIEYMINLRRVMITKVSTLSHLIGYEHHEKEKSLFSNITTIIPQNNEILELKNKLEKIISSDDKTTRNLFVHYLYNGINQIPELIHKLSIDQPLDYLKELAQLMTIYNQLSMFLGKAIEYENSKIKELQEKKLHSPKM